jgi:hypothetical protein
MAKSTYKSIYKSTVPVREDRLNTTITYGGTASDLVNLTTRKCLRAKIGILPDNFLSGMACNIHTGYHKRRGSNFSCACRMYQLTAFYEYLQPLRTNSERG